MRIALPWPAGLGATPSGNPYSRRVARLKLILPAIGVALLLTVTAWPRLAPLFERLRFSWPAIDLRDARELRMLNPRYQGTDRNNHPFVLTAASGRQVPDRQDLMALTEPHADMQTRGGANLVLTSDSGMYQSQAQLLDMFRDVTLIHQNGTRFLTQSAHLDFAANSGDGHQAIEGHGPSGDVWGDGFEIIDKGDTIIFTGNARLIAKSTKPAAVATAAPPALPDAVLATAARAQAEVRPVAATRTAKPAPAVARTNRPAAVHPAHPAAAGNRRGTASPVDKTAPRRPD